LSDDLSKASALALTFSSKRILDAGRRAKAANRNNQQTAAATHLCANFLEPHTMVHGLEYVDLPGERSLGEWAQFGDWLICGAFIAYEQQTGAASGPMVQLCRGVHQQLKAAMAAARPEDFLPYSVSDISALLPALPPGARFMMATSAAVFKVAATLTQEQLQAVDTVHNWIKGECLLVGYPTRAQCSLAAQTARLCGSADATLNVQSSALCAVPHVSPTRLRTLPVCSCLAACPFLRQILCGASGTAAIQQQPRTLPPSTSSLTAWPPLPTAASP
jgi:hypothetical protein